MRETTCALRWASVRGHLLCLTVEHARDRAPRGPRLDAVVTAMVAHHASADRPRPGWRQRLAPPDVVRFEGIRCCRRGGRRTSSVRLKPLGLGDLLAMLPLLQPTLCPAQLPAEHRNRVTGQGALKPLWTAPLQGCRRSSRFPPLLLPSCMTIGSRCYGTMLTCPGWHVLFLMAASWHAWHAGSPRPDGCGGFLSRWDPRLPRPALRAGSPTRHLMLSASVDESRQAQRRRPHLNDGVLGRP